MVHVHVHICKLHTSKINVFWIFQRVLTHICIQFFQTGVTCVLLLIVLERHHSHIFAMKIMKTMYKRYFSGPGFLNFNSFLQSGLLAHSLDLFFKNISVPLLYHYHMLSRLQYSIKFYFDYIYDMPTSIIIKNVYIQKI